MLSVAMMLLVVLSVLLPPSGGSGGGGGGGSCTAAARVALRRVAPRRAGRGAGGHASDRSSLSALPTRPQT